MPLVLVHGVPETPAVWGPLRTVLGRDDVVALQMPGFGCPRPDGFGATKDDYAAWLIAELERLAADHGPGSVDLVGHDWGGGLTVRAVSQRADLVRSWVTDAAGLGDLDFEWHDFAKIWQTPGAGEEFFEQQLAAGPDERAGVFEMFGIPHDEAVALGGAIDTTMTECILALYRSAVDVGREWGPAFKDVAAPGLVLMPSDDPFLSAKSAEIGAASSGAAVARLADTGHWWMLQNPKLGAETLERFWATLP